MKKLFVPLLLVSSLFANSPNCDLKSKEARLSLKSTLEGIGILDSDICKHLDKITSLTLISSGSNKYDLQGLVNLKRLVLLFRNEIYLNPGFFEHVPNLTMLKIHTDARDIKYDGEYYDPDSSIYFHSGSFGKELENLEKFELQGYYHKVDLKLDNIKDSKELLTIPSQLLKGMKSLKEFKWIVSAIKEEKYPDEKKIYDIDDLSVFLENKKLKLSLVNGRLVNSLSEKLRKNNISYDTSFVIPKFDLRVKKFLNQNTNVIEDHIYFYNEFAGLQSASWSLKRSFNFGKRIYLKVKYNRSAGQSNGLESGVFRFNFEKYCSNVLDKSSVFINSSSNDFELYINGVKHAKLKCFKNKILGVEKI